jgi:hypothetical protein
LAAEARLELFGVRALRKAEYVHVRVVAAEGAAPDDLSNSISRSKRAPLGEWVGGNTYWRGVCAAQSWNRGGALWGQSDQAGARAVFWMSTPMSDAAYAAFTGRDGTGSGGRTRGLAGWNAIRQWRSQ